MTKQSVQTLLQQRHDDMTKSREVMFTALYGSQNYGLAVPGSDVDAYSVYLPTKEDLVFGRTRTVTHKTETGNVTGKDIRDMAAAYMKQSINFCETLVTPYVIVNPTYKKEVSQLRWNADNIISANLYQQLRTTAGMMLNQRDKAMKSDDMRAAVRAMHCAQFIMRRLEGASFDDAIMAKNAPGDIYTVMLAMKRGYIGDMREMERLVDMARTAWDRYKDDHDESEYDDDVARAKTVLAGIAYSAMTRHLER